MAAELTTQERQKDQLDPRSPAYLELEGWEFLRQPIDEDIDEGDYVEEGKSMIDVSKRRMIRLKYQRIGKAKMQKQKLEEESKELKPEPCIEEEFLHQEIGGNPEQPDQPS